MISHIEYQARAFRFNFQKDGKEVGRARLCLINNDNHKCPYGLLEDVDVIPEFQNQGIGTQLVKEAIQKARDESCYKLIATSRFERANVHDLYERLGFHVHGKEFRMDF